MYVLWKIPLGIWLWFPWIYRIICGGMSIFTMPSLSDQIHEHFLHLFGFSFMPFRKIFIIFLHVYLADFQFIFRYFAVLCLLWIGSFFITFCSSYCRIEASYYFHMLILCLASWPNSVKSGNLLQILLDFLNTQLCCLQILTVLFLPFKFLCHLLSLSFNWLGHPGQCEIVVGILLLFLIPAGIILLFHH